VVLRDRKGEEMISTYIADHAEAVFFYA